MNTWITILTLFASGLIIGVAGLYFANIYALVTGLVVMIAVTFVLFKNID